MNCRKWFLISEIILKIEWNKKENCTAKKNQEPIISENELEAARNRRELKIELIKYKKAWANHVE